MPDRIERIIKALLKLRDEANDQFKCNIVLNQQDLNPDHISFSVDKGAGRLYIDLRKDGYDIVLSGQEVEDKMTPLMVMLFERSCDRYKQKKQRSPSWRIPADDLDILRKAVFSYAETMIRIYG